MIPDMVHNTLEVLVVDCYVVNVNSGNVEATNSQQASTIPYLGKSMHISTLVVYMCKCMFTTILVVKSTKMLQNKKTHEDCESLHG